MKIQQLSLFLENRPGQLSHVCETLRDAGINILTLSLADAQQFSILRLIVQEWEAARDILSGAGTVVNVTDMVAIEVENRPGGLHDVLQIVESVGINIEYMYAFTTRHENRGILIFRFNDPDAAIRVLQEKNVKVVRSADLYEEMG